MGARVSAVNQENSTAQTSMTVQTGIVRCILLQMPWPKTLIYVFLYPGGERKIFLATSRQASHEHWIK